MDDPLSTSRMDKTQWSIASLDDAPDDPKYWSTKTPEERLEALELMRMVCYGYDPATARLQRSIEIVEFGAG